MLANHKYQAGSAIAWIVIVVIVLAGAGAAAYYYTDWFQGDDKKQSASQSKAETGTTSDQPAFPNQDQLAGLKNYVAEASTNGYTTTQEVYSDTNYRETTPDGLKQALVNGTLWSTSTVASGVPDGAKADPDNQPALSRYAKILHDYAKDSSVTITLIGDCQVAGQDGDQWELRSSSEAQPGNPVYDYNACTDAQEGHLLSLVEGVNLKADNEAIHSKVSVTKIGGVNKFSKNDV